MRVNISILSVVSPVAECVGPFFLQNARVKWESKQSSLYGWDPNSSKSAAHSWMFFMKQVNTWQGCLALLCRRLQTYSLDHINATMPVKTPGLFGPDFKHCLCTLFTFADLLCGQVAEKNNIIPLKLNVWHLKWEEGCYMNTSCRCGSVLSYGPVKSVLYYYHCYTEWSRY